MIPFPLNESRFSFFVADHQLVGQFCTNPKSDRSLLSCLKVTQCSTSEIGDAPLYKHALYRSKLWQQDHCQNHRWIATNNRDVPRVMKTKFPAIIMIFGVVSSEGHIMFPHIFEVGLKVNAKVPSPGFRRSATTLYPSLPAPSSPDLNPRDYFV